MLERIFISIVSGLLFALQMHGQENPKGSLVIVGGGLEPDNKSVFQQLIGLAGGPEKASFAVIPSAGEAPVQSFVYFRSELAAYGVNPGNVHLIPIAMMDDDSTREVNESDWKTNGNDGKLAELVGECTAVWFTGGDQLRTTRTLLNPDGSQTAVLKAVWDVYLSGGVVGGTSAGAAIMSRVMIGGGTSLAALTRGVIVNYQGDDFPEDTGVLVTPGLGFFPYGVVDQHFNQRARIGRLAVVLTDRIRQLSATGNEPVDNVPMGFGVDENTAMIYEAGQKKMSVAGTGGVTLLDAKNVRIRDDRLPACIEGLRVSYLEEGDAFDFQTGAVIPSPGKKNIRGKEACADPFPGRYGLLVSDPYSFRDIYTRYLIDNNRSDPVQTITFTVHDTGINIIIYKDEQSLGFFATEGGKRRRYTVTGLRMDFIPVKISAVPIQK